MVEEKNVIRGKKSKAAGSRFELKVRKDLEREGWIVSKWMNNVDIDNNTLIPAKHKFRGKGIPMAIGTGFPDFIVYSLCKHQEIEAFDINASKFKTKGFIVFGVEAKSNGYLTKEEKEKCKWLLENNKFSKIFIAKKGIKRGEILYTEFK